MNHKISFDLVVSFLQICFASIRSTARRFIDASGLGRCLQDFHALGKLGVFVAGLLVAGNGMSEAISATAIAEGAYGDSGRDAVRAVQFESSAVVPPFPVSSVQAAPAGSFGTSVALDGSTLVIGAAGDYIAGAQGVFIYELQGQVWTLRQVLEAPVGLPDGARFGQVIDLHGDSLFVAAPNAGAFASRGAVFVYERSNGEWAFRQLLEPDEPVFGVDPILFGAAIALDDDTAVIGAPGRVGQDVFRGSAYVFRRINGSWIVEQRLVDDAGRAFDYFGASVDVGGRTAILMGKDDDGGVPGGRIGAVHVFQRPAARWEASGKLPNPARLDLWGAVRFDAGTRTVATGGRSPGGEAVAVFEETGGTWSQKQILSGPAESGFGWALAVNSQLLIIGAPGARLGTSDNQGAAFVYRLVDDSWRYTSTIAARNGRPDELFAEAVAVDTDFFVLGVPRTIGPIAVIDGVEAPYSTHYGVVYFASADVLFAHEFEPEKTMNK